MPSWAAYFESVVPSCLLPSAHQAPSCPRSGLLPFPVAIPPTSLSMSAKRFSCFSMSFLPLSQPFKSAKRHSIHSCRYPSALLPHPSRNLVPLCPVCLSPPSRPPCALCGVPKIFSNHWKTAEKFFQSLEKTGEIFQPLEKKVFQSLEKRPFAAEPADCATPKRGFSAGGFIRLKWQTTVRNIQVGKGRHHDRTGSAGIIEGAGEFRRLPFRGSIRRPSGRAACRRRRPRGRR